MSLTRDREPMAADLEAVADSAWRLRSLAGQDAADREERAV
jgi:hypothetical protein